MELFNPILLAGPVVLFIDVSCFFLDITDLVPSPDFGFLVWVRRLLVGMVAGCLESKPRDDVGLDVRRLEPDVLGANSGLLRLGFLLSSFILSGCGGVCCLNQPRLPPFRSCKIKKDEMKCNFDISNCYSMHYAINMLHCKTGYIVEHYYMI